MLLHPLVEESDAGVVGDDPLAFPGYREQLARAGGEAVDRALASAVPGDRAARLDRATRRWLR